MSKPVAVDVQAAPAGIRWDLEVDVLVVGAGGCGMAAAIAAHDAGAQVAIVEKRDRPGGNSSLSTGSVPGAGSRFQREAGIEDSVETMIADLRRIAGDGELPALTERMARISAELCEWLVDRVGARMSLITDYCHVGHTGPRLHAPRSRRGQDLVDDLVAAVERREIPLAVGNPVRTLYRDADGAITEVKRWLVQCGPLDPPGKDKQVEAGPPRMVTSRPFAGLTLDASNNCTAASADALRGAAGLSEALASEDGNSPVMGHWVREGSR